MIWYFPAFNGDFRLVEQADKRTDLIVHEPTAAEQELLGTFFMEARSQGWITKRQVKAPEEIIQGTYIFDGPMAEVAPALYKLVRPEKAVLTAFKYEKGHCEVVEGGPAPLTALAKRDEKPADEEPEGGDPGLFDRLRGKKKPEKAVTVKRPDRGCPDCVVGAVPPASEVLQAFLTPEQHETWAKHRAFITRGGATGQRYLLAHRHTAVAAKNKRVAFSLDTNEPVLAHDWSVPPEEEVLAIKLYLEHREEQLTHGIWGTRLDHGIAWGLGRLVRS